MSNDKPFWQSKRLWSAIGTVIAILVVAWRPEFAAHEVAIAEEIAKIALALLAAFTVQDTIVGSVKAHNATIDISDVLNGKHDK